MGAGLPALSDEIRNDPAAFIIYQNGKRITEGALSGYQTALERGVRLQDIRILRDVRGN